MHMYQKWQNEKWSQFMRPVSEAYVMGLRNTVILHCFDMLVGQWEGHPACEKYCHNNYQV